MLLSYNLAIGLDDMFQYDMLARSLSTGHGFRWYAQDDLKLIAPDDLATHAAAAGFTLEESSEVASSAGKQFAVQIFRATQSDERS